MSAALDTDPSRAPLPTRHDDVVVFRTSRRRIFFVFFDGDTDFDSVHDFRTDLIQHRRTKTKKKRQRELVLPRRLGCITPLGVVAGRSSAKFSREDFIFCACVAWSSRSVFVVPSCALLSVFFFFLVTNVLFYCAHPDWCPLQLQRIDSFCR